MNMSQIVNFVNIYPTICAKVNKVSTLYHLSKCFDFCEQESKFYREQFTKILDEYGMRREDGTLQTQGDNIKIIDGKENECQEAINALLSIEVEIPENVFVRLDEIEDLEMDMETFKSLKSFIKE